MNPIEMIQQFNNFKNNFHGDAQAEVQRLMQSGKMTQSQFNKLQRTASVFQQMINNFK